MRRLSIFIFATIITFQSLAQSGYPAFGKADINELLLKECPFEKDANAMKLLDYQETEITTTGYDVRIRIERRTRIKIFTKAGFDAANILIPYVRRGRKTKINDITAYIYQLDSTGKNILTNKLDKHQIFKEKKEDGLNTVAFTFPNVEVGCVIEYRYTHIEKNSLHIEPWFFQDRIPTAISECQFIYPNGFRFDYRFISDSVKKSYVYKQMRNIRTFSQQNILSFRPEPMMSSVKDNLKRIEFAYQPSGFSGRVYIGSQWNLYNRMLLVSPYFGAQIYAKIDCAETILDSVKKIISSIDRIHYIYQSVKSILKWDETLSFYADDLSEVWKTRSANSAEINLSILNLLIKAGIRAFPILISTRNNGQPDPDFMSLGQFNSVDILVADSVEIFVLDGTQKYISYKTPPYNILNRDVFLIDTTEHKWINISDTRPLMRTNITLKAVLSNTGELKGEAFNSYYDHSKAIQLEEQNTTKTEKEKEEEDKEFIGKDFINLVIDSLVEENAEDELLPLNHKFKFTYHLSSTDNYFFLDPFFLSSFRKNPFSDSVRYTDIDMGSNQLFSIYLHLSIPDEFIIDDLPANILIRSNDSSMLFKREILRQANVLVIRSTFDIKRTIYSKEEYPGIREYFKKIYGVISDQVVLKKRS